jgi:branched-chain amino acid transport system permease protein
LTLAGIPITSAAGLFYVVVPVTLIMFALTANLLNSRIGRAMAAVRQSEVAASTAGINVLLYKAFAFALSGVFGALGGGLQALQTTYLDPQSFGILDSVLFIAIIVIGGFRSMAGAVLGSAVFTFMPAMLGTFQSYRGLAFALLLLATIVLFPGGLANLVKIAIGAALTRFGRSKP